MADKLQADFVPGATVYFILRDTAGLAYSTAAAGFEAYLSADYADYALPAAEQGGTGTSGFFTAPVPTALEAGLYGVVAKTQAGDDPDETDLSIGGDTLNWDGTAVLGLADVDGGSASTQPGTVPVDHDFGGADALRVMNLDDTPVVGGTIVVYLAADYAAGRRNTDYVQGRSTTGADGRWVAPVLLFPGDYVLIASRPRQGLPFRADFVVE